MGRRARLGLVVAALIAVGCGGSKAAKDSGDSEVGSGVSLKSTLTTAAGATTTTAAKPTVPGGGTAKPGKTTTTKAGAPAGTTRPPPAPGIDPIVYAAAGNPGNAAAVILQPEPAKRLIVEIMVQPGAIANKTATDRVIAYLKELTGKPVAEVRTPLPASNENDPEWNEGEVEELADKHAKVPQGNGQFAFRFLYLKGHKRATVPNTVVLGTAYRGDLFAAFPDQYEHPTTSQNLITAVTVHETGHLLGLVDMYLDNNRSDPNDPAKHGHSKNERSVMYWKVESSLIGQLFNSASTTFDAEDLRDLNAIRKGAPPGSKA